MTKATSCSTSRTAQPSVRAVRRTTSASRTRSSAVVPDAGSSRSCNAAEGTHHEGDTIFERYRQRPPAAILGVTVRYINPVTGKEAGPALEAEADEADRWSHAASQDIGL